MLFLNPESEIQTFITFGLHYFFFVSVVDWMQLYNQEIVNSVSAIFLLNYLPILKMIFSMKLWYISKSCVILFQFSSAREVMFLLLRTLFSSTCTLGMYFQIAIHIFFLSICKWLRASYLAIIAVHIFGTKALAIFLLWKGQQSIFFLPYFHF